MSVFHTQGPVPPHSPSYAERPADAKVRELLLKGESVCLVGPPLIGKSSLLLKVGASLVPAGFEFQLLDSIDLDALGLGEALEALWRKRAEIPGKLLVAIDGVGRSGLEGVNSVLSQVRRLLEEARGAVIALAGTFLPRPGETAPLKEVRLGFFHRPQVMQLVSLLGLQGEALKTITDVIYRWSEGHPYVVQSLCALLEGKGHPLSEGDVEKAVMEFIRTDAKLLPAIRSALASSAEARQLAQEIRRGARVKYRAVLPLIRRHPALWACFRSDEKGFCRISATCALLGKMLL